MPRHWSIACSSACAISAAAFGWAKMIPSSSVGRTRSVEGVDLARVRAMGECKSAVTRVAIACQEHPYDGRGVARAHATSNTWRGAYGAMGRAWQRHRDGSSAFFAEYLETTGLFQRWLESCPLSYTSPSW
jgi:hypothetical protein